MQKELDCVLINPPRSYNKSNIWREVDSNYPPLGLASIAGFLRQQNYSVEILDSNTEACSLHEFQSLFQKRYRHRRIRFIGITATTPTIKKAYRISEICSKLHKESKIAFGGPHPTFMIQEVLSHKNIDYVICGEGEITFAELLSGKSLKSINGLAFKREGKIIINKPRQRILDLDNFPMPAYDLLPLKKYHPAAGTYKRLPAMSMVTVRGCPGRCTFCNKTLGNRVVYKRARTIYNEIIYLKKKFGIKEISFYDDTFTVFRDNVMELCRLLTENKTDITWSCFARVDYINQELLSAMKKAGCHQIMFGMENSDEKVLANIKKSITMKQVSEAVRITKEQGIDCRIALMVGNPGETKESIEANIRFVNDLNPDLLIVNITTPFPGTEMYQWAKANDLLLTENWDAYNLSNPVMRLDMLTEKDIRESYKLMYRRFYLRFNYIAGRLRKIRSLYDLQVLFRGFRALIGFFSS